VSTSRQTLVDLCILGMGAALYTLASPPQEWSSAAWFALAPLFFVVRRRTPKAAFAAGFGYAVLCCLGITRWIYFASSAFFGLSFPWDVLFTFFTYAFFGGCYTGMAAVFSALIMHNAPPLLRWGAVPALWVSVEAARSYLGFSWVILGYTQYQHLALIQIAEVTGVYGLSFLMAQTSYLCAEMAFVLSQRGKTGEQQVSFPWSAVAGLLIAVALTWGYGEMRLRQYEETEPASGAVVTTALVQGKATNVQRWMPEHYAGTLLHYASLTRLGVNERHVQLVVWPEFAMGFYLNQNTLLRTQLSAFAQQLNAFLLLGAPRTEATPTGNRYYNSAYLLTPTGEIADVYDKIRLVPLAEYRLVPLVPSTAPPERPGQPPAEFTAGSRSTVFSLPHGSFGVMICYEATYPHLARRLVRNGAQLLVNISNDTWLAAGGRAASAQHFSMVVFRAVETRRYLARSATSGVSGFIDPTGRAFQLSETENQAIIGNVFPRQELTLYVRYGDWFVGVCALFTVLTLLVTKPVGPSSKQHSALFHKAS
jgi:apolipoprotein N-acyltransferase